MKEREIQPKDDSRWLLLIPALFLILYTVFFFRLRELPLLDLPNHLVRSQLVGQILAGLSLGERFSLDLSFRPYVLGDLLLASAMKVFSYEVVGMLWMSLCFLVLPLGIWGYAKSREESPFVIFVAVLSGTYLASNWFFLAGYTSYCLGVGLVFLTLASWERCCAKVKPPNRACLCWVLLLISVTFCYALHLATFFFCGIVVPAAALVKRLKKECSWKVLGATLLPFILVTAYHIASARGHAPVSGQWEFRSALDKFLSLGQVFVRYSYRLDISLLGAFFIYFLLLIYDGRKNKRHWVEALDYGLYLLVFLFVFLLLPEKVGAAHDIDIRSMPFIFVFFALFAAKISGGALRLKWGRSGFDGNALFLAVFLVLLNFVYLVSNLLPQNSFLREYREAVSSIPPQQRVLPVAAKPDVGRIQYASHHALPYLLEKGGFVPYMFNKRVENSPVEHIVYVQHYDAPDQRWYLDNLPVDWNLVQRNFDYIIITKPFAKERLSALELEEVFQNKAAQVFKIISEKGRKID